MFRNAFIPRTKVVPATGSAVTMGFPLGTGRPVVGSTALGSALYPRGWSSNPEKIVASKTERKVKNAETSASFDNALKVLGREHTQQMIADMTENTTVHWEWFVMVFKYLAVTRTCSA